MELKKTDNSKVTKKVTSLFSVLLMLFYIIVPNTAITFADTASKVFDVIDITDFHGTLLDSYNNQVGAVLAKKIKDAVNTNPDRSMVIGGGDLYQGSALSNILRGEPVMKMMNSIGMEATTVGNHEFDWGLNTVVTDKANYPFICANLYDKATGKRVFAPYKMITKDGVKIAVVGGITMETPTIVAAQFVNGYEFKDLATEVNEAAKEAKDAGAQIVIADLHAGDNMDGKTGEVFDVANKLQGVDAVMGGHSHNKVTTALANGTPVTIASSNGKGYTDLKITLNADGTKTFSASFVDLYKDKTTLVDNTVDDAVYKAVIDAQAQVGPILSEKLGTAQIDLTKLQKVSPFGESLVGNWSTDAMTKAANADFGFANNGGLRSDIPKGQLTMSTMYQFMPFDNELVTFKMTAPQIKMVLEDAIGIDPKNGQGAKGTQVSGLKFTYDPTKPFGQKVLKIVKADGTVLDLNDTTTKYTVATNDFMAGGKDGFTEFIDPVVAPTLVHTGILVRDALAQSIKDAEKAGKQVTANYENRIMSNVDTINILATSDVHGCVYPTDYFTGAPIKSGLAKVATYVNTQRASNPNLLLLDNGDTIQGTPLVSYYNKDASVEYPMAKAMGILKYDTWTLGNHEFNFGLTVLNKVIADMKSEGIEPVSANIYKEDNTNFVKPYVIKEVKTDDGIVKVGILGLTTKCVPNWENPDNYKGLKFNDLVDEAKKWVPVMKQNGADVVVVAMHSGEESASDTIPENEVKAVAANVDGIDVIVAGHTHKNTSEADFTNPSGKTVIETEPGKSGAYVSNISIGLQKNDKGAWTVVQKSSQTVAMDDSVKPDDTVMKALQTYQDKTMAYINTVIGASEGEFSGKTQTTEETAIMDLINKVQLQASGAQLSIAAPLSSGAFIPKGNVSIKDISSVYVFENFLYSVKMTGEQLKKWLEFSARYYSQVKNANDPITKDAVANIPDYNLDILYGATYTIDLTQPAGSRIKNLMYNGKEIKDTDVFTVAVNNYRYNGGGGFMAAAGLTPGAGAIYDSAKALGDDGQVRNLMIKYIQDNKTITPKVDSYMTISTTPVAVQDTTNTAVYAKDFTDVSASHWAYEYVKTLVANNITKGVDAEQTKFDPNGKVTRAQFAAFIVRALGLDAKSGEDIFTDVTKDKWYYNEVTAAKKAGIIDGVDASKFAPDAQITREQMAKMIMKAYEYKTEKKAEDLAKNYTGTFTDMDKVSAWAADYVKAANEEGFIGGFSDGSYGPSANAERAQVAKVIVEMLQKAGVL